MCEPSSIILISCITFVLVCLIIYMQVKFYKLRCDYLRLAESYKALGNHLKSQPLYNQKGGIQNCSEEKESYYGKA